MSSSATTRSLDPDLRATHGQSEEFRMLDYMTLKPPRMGKSIPYQRRLSVPPDRMRG